MSKGGPLSLSDMGSQLFFKMAGKVETGNQFTFSIKNRINKNLKDIFCTNNYTNQLLYFSSFL